MMKAIIFTLIQIFAWQAFATPAVVMIIRHGEKPIDESDIHLSARGYARARALVKVFNGENDDLPVPDYIFAQSPRTDHGSVRSEETVEPLADSLHKRVRDDFEVDEAKHLVKYILHSEKFDGKVVLIAWGHSEIPKIARKLGADDFPDKWKGKIFDRVWKIKFKDGEVKYSQDLPMKALPGDSRQKGARACLNVL